MLHLAELHVESVPFESQDTRSHELDGRLDAVSYSVLQSFKEDFGDAISDPTSNISFFDLVQSVPCPSPAPSLSSHNAALSLKPWRARVLWTVHLQPRQRRQPPDLSGNGSTQLVVVHTAPCPSVASAS